MILPVDENRGPFGSYALTLTIPIPTPLLTINARRRMHWRTQARETRQQRGDVRYWLNGLPENRAALYHTRPGDHFGTSRVRVDVTVYPRKGMQRHDDSAIWEALKPILDGLEDCGLVANDRQFIYGALTWETARLGQFVLTLTREEDVTR